MKTVTNHLINISLLLAFLLTAVPLYAQTDETTDAETTTVTETDSRLTPEEGRELFENRQEEFQNQVEERQANMEERRADAEAAISERREEFQAAQEERREALSERVMERITNLAANVSNRLDAAVGRMQNIIDRLNTRIEKLKERGLDTSEAETHMDNAQDAVNAAIALLENIDEVVNNAVTAEDPRTAWQNAKTEFLSIKESIKSAHASLRAAVAALKTATQEMPDGNGASAAVQADEAFEKDNDDENGAGPTANTNEETLPSTTQVSEITFINNLIDCVASETEFDHPFFGGVMKKQIKGIENGLCVYVEEMPGNMKLTCKYNKDDRVVASNYYKIFLDAESVDVTGEITGESVESTTVVDGVNIGENPLQTFTNNGTCTVGQ